MRRAARGRGKAHARRATPWRDGGRFSRRLVVLRLELRDGFKGHTPRASGPRGGEATGEQREGRAIGTDRRQPDADARGTLDDARCDLDEPKAQRGELGTA